MKYIFNTFYILFTHNIYINYTHVYIYLYTHIVFINRVNVSIHVHINQRLVGVYCCRSMPSDDYPFHGGVGWIANCQP